MLARWLRRSEAKRKADWVATHPPLPDIDFAVQTGAADDHATSVALRVRGIVAHWAGIPPSHIYPDASLEELSKLEWDGANAAELELSLEEAFGFEMRQVLSRIKTVRDIVLFFKSTR